MSDYKATLFYFFRQLTNKNTQNEISWKWNFNFFELIC